MNKSVCVPDQSDKSSKPHTSTSAMIQGHIQIARIDHWVKNVFVLPGIIVAASISHSLEIVQLFLNTLVGLFSIGLIASSNYTINELLDGVYDAEHPKKRNRPVPSGQVNKKFAYVQWIALMILGLSVGFFINIYFVLVALSLWIMGVVYNTPPFRTKELPFLDVASESINNPIRMLAGWYIVNPPAVAPASLLLSYWMIGCYFMALKRYAELRSIGDRSLAAKYRKSFQYYTLERLLVSVVFYCACSMLFLGVFIVRYRMELILAFPFIAYLMALYLNLSFKDDSSVQAPEKLHTEKGLLASILFCCILLSTLMFVDIPLIYSLFSPLAPAPFNTL